MKNLKIFTGMAAALAAILLVSLVFLYGVTIAGDLLSSPSDTAVLLGIFLYFVLFMFCPGLVITLIWAIYRALVPTKSPGEK